MLLQNTSGQESPLSANIVSTVCDWVLAFGEQRRGGATSLVSAFQAGRLPLSFLSQVSMPPAWSEVLKWRCLHLGVCLGLGIISGAPGPPGHSPWWPAQLSHMGGLEAPRPTVQDNWGLLQRAVLCRGCEMRGLSPG